MCLLPAILASVGRISANERSFLKYTKLSGRDHRPHAEEKRMKFGAETARRWNHFVADSFRRRHEEETLMRCPELQCMSDIFRSFIMEMSWIHTVLDAFVYFFYVFGL